MRDIESCFKHSNCQLYRSLRPSTDVLGGVRCECSCHPSGHFDKTRKCTATSCVGFKPSSPLEALTYDSICLCGQSLAFHDQGLYDLPIASGHPRLAVSTHIVSTTRVPESPAQIPTLHPFHDIDPAARMPISVPIPLAPSTIFRAADPPPQTSPSHSEISLVPELTRAPQAASFPVQGQHLFGENLSTPIMSIQRALIERQRTDSGNVNQRRTASGRQARIDNVAGRRGGRSRSGVSRRAAYHPFAPGPSARGEDRRLDSENPFNVSLNPSIASHTVELCIAVLPSVKHACGLSQNDKLRGKDAPEGIMRFNSYSISDIIGRLEVVGLVLYIKIVDTDEPVWSELDKAIQVQLNDHRIFMSRRNGPVSFSNLPWRAFTPGYKIASSYKFSVDSEISGPGFTVKYLFQKCSRIKHENIPVLFIGPRYANLCGPLSFVPGADSHIHRCFSERVMPTSEAWTLSISEGECLPECQVEQVCQHEDRVTAAATGERTGSQQHTGLLELGNVEPHVPYTSEREILANPTLIGMYSQSESMEPPAPLNRSVLPNRTGAVLPIQISPGVSSSSPTIQDAQEEPDFGVYDTVSEWFAAVKQKCSDFWNGSNPTRISCASPILAANELFRQTKAMHTAPPSSEYQYINTDFSVPGLLSAATMFRAGPGIGRGVERGVYNQLFTQVLEGDTLSWAPVGQFMTVSFPSVAGHDPSQEATLKAWGTLTAVHILRFGCAPVAISPFLLQAVAGGVDSILNIDFITQHAPEQREYFHTWLALDPQCTLRYGTNPDTDKVLGLLVGIVSMEIQHLTRNLHAHTLSGKTVHRTLALRLAKSLLLKDDGGVGDMHPNFKAFQDGFNIHIMNGVTLSKLLKVNSMRLISSMVNRHVTDVEDWFKRIKWGELSSHVAEIEVFKFKLILYLRKKGHVNHPYLANTISPETRLKDKEDGFLRVRALHLAATGSSVVPIGLWGIAVHFQESLPPLYVWHGRQDGGQSQLPPMIFHTCTNTIDVIMTKELVNILREAPEDRTAGNDYYFDAWVHQQLFVGEVEGYSID